MPRLLVHKRAFVSTIVTALALSGAADISVPARAANVPRTLPAGATRTLSTGALPAGVAESVTAVAFPDASAGWALGADGGATRIWHTATPGSAWQVQWRGSGTPLAITASDPAHAWALTGCAKPCGRRLLGTTDGGSVWRVFYSWPASASASVGRVQFVTPRLGVATAGGALLVSRDGGAHWRRTLRQAGPVFAAATASGQLWAAETVPGAARNAAGIRFVTSADGGQTWHRLGQLTGRWPLSPSVRVTLAVTGGKLSWASVFDQESCAMHGCGVANVLSSADGGRTWHAVNLPDGQPDECGSASVVLSAAPDGAVWAALGRNGAACAPPLGLVYLHAGGAAWRELVPWQLTTVSSLSAVSGRVAYAIGDQGELSRTEDGGQRWTQVLPSAVPSGSLAAAGGVVYGAQDGTGAGAVLRAVPGGRWRQVADLPGVVTQLGFSSATKGFALSYTPGAKPAWRLWTTSDGGASWTAPGGLPATSGVIEGPWLTADGHGVLLTVASGTPWQPADGGTGAVREWITGNGGATWTRGAAVPLGRDTLDGPASFWYSPSGGWTGWLSVANASYTQQVVALSGGRLSVLPGNPPASSVQLTGPGAGLTWGVTYTSHSSTLVIYRTSDNGRTWQHASIGLPASDEDQTLLGFATLNDGWLTLGGTTWHTTNSGLTWQAD